MIVILVIVGIKFLVMGSFRYFLEDIIDVNKGSVCFMRVVLIICFRFLIFDFIFFLYFIDSLDRIFRIILRI